MPSWPSSTSIVSVSPIIFTFLAPHRQSALSLSAISSVLNLDNGQLIRWQTARRTSRIGAWPTRMLTAQKSRGGRLADAPAVYCLIFHSIMSGTAGGNTEQAEWAVD